MRSLVRYFVLLALLSVSCPVSGQWTYNISDDVNQHIFVYEFIQYLEDPAGDITVADVLDTTQNLPFRPSAEFVPKNYNVDATYWVRVKIGHHSHAQNKWLLEFFDQTIDSLWAYIPNERGVYTTRFYGDKTAFSHRPFKHKNFVIPIENDHDEELTYIFKVKASHPVDILLVIRSYTFFSFYSLNEYFFFGIFYGLIILIGLYNLLLYFAIRETPYLYFVLYSFSVGLYFSSSDGFAYQYIWPHWSEWNQVAYGVFMFAMSACAILFTKKFLHLKAKAPRLNHFLNGLLLVRTLLFVLSLVWFPLWFDYLYIDILPLAILLGISAYFLYKGYKPARLVMLAFLFLLIGSVTKLLLSTGIGNIEADVLNYYAINITFLMQLITLSFALGDKVRILKRMKDRAMKRIVAQHEANSRLQTKVNRELEQRVSERTIELDNKNMELKQAYQKLEEHAEEIDKMNSLLDRDNYKIKRQSRQELQRKLLSRGVGYEEFKKVFPDDASCNQYLADRKWGDGFVCRKCDYNSATTQDNFAHRCSRCGYIESVTAHTVFHGVRFPLNKAFFISHVELSGRSITTTRLSELLDLRLATCSKFRQKVSKTLAEKETVSPAEKEDLIIFE